MAQQLTTASIGEGLVIEPGHVTQSVLAFTGGEAYDITISGSLTNTGPATLTGLTNLVASDASNLTLEINESASFEFLTGAPNSGSFIVQTSPDTGLGSLESFFGQGTAVAAAQNIPNQIFGIKYASGSGASEGELTMTVGKRDLSNLGGANQNNFYVSYEPSGIFTNAQGELEFFVGEHQNVGYGVLSVYRGGASSLTQTSSFAGYFSSSAFPNQQQYTRPFAISTLTQVNDSNPAFVINKDITDLTTSNFSVDYGGNVTTSGNISSSSTIYGATGSFSYLTGSSPITVVAPIVNNKTILTQVSATSSIDLSIGNYHTFDTDAQGASGQNQNFFLKNGTAGQSGHLVIFVGAEEQLASIDFSGLNSRILTGSNMANYDNTPTANTSQMFSYMVTSTDSSPTLVLELIGQNLPGNLS